MASGADIASACKVLLHVLSIDIRRKTMLFLKQHSVYFNSGDTRQCPICEHVHISVYYLFNLTVKVEYQMNMSWQTHREKVLSFSKHL